MAPGWVVEALDEVEHGHAGIGLGAKAAPIEQFALERGEERLGQRVVVGIADRSGAGADVTLSPKCPCS